MVIGYTPTGEDVDVNVCKTKHLTNTRASGSDDALRLVPHQPPEPGGLPGIPGPRRAAGGHPQEPAHPQADPEPRAAHEGPQQEQVIFAKNGKTRTGRLPLLNSTPFVRQYGILNNKWGVLLCQKGIPNKRYTPEFKKQVVEAVIQDGLSYQEAARIYEVQGHDRIQSWERIYLEEGPEGLALERRGRKSTGRPKKLPSKVEEDLLAEVQRLRAENAYLKNLQALVLEEERRQRKKRR